LPRSLIDKLFACFRSLPSKEFQFFVVQLIGGNKEFFDFFADLFAQLTRVVF
jgi:hypothetical protein